MIAQHEAVRFQIVQRVIEFFQLRPSFVAGTHHLVLFASHHRFSVGFRQERKALSEDQLVWNGQQPIEHARPRPGWIFLKAKHSRKAAGSSCLISTVSRPTMMRSE